MARSSLVKIQPLYADDILHGSTALQRHTRLQAVVEYSRYLLKVRAFASFFESATPR